MIKQSDAAQFKQQYSKKTDLLNLQSKSHDRRTVFGLETLKSVKDFSIPLEKFLQVMLIFKTGGYEAYHNKRDLLNVKTSTNFIVNEFLRSSNATTDLLLNLYLFYVRLEKEQKKLDSVEKVLVPYYCIDVFSKYECQGNIQESAKYLTDQSKINLLIKRYTKMCNKYHKKYTKQNNTDYHGMIMFVNSKVSHALA